VIKHVLFSTHDIVLNKLHYSLITVATLKLYEKLFNCLIARFSDNSILALPHRDVWNERIKNGTQEL